MRTAKGHRLAWSELARAREGVAALELALLAPTLLLLLMGMFDLAQLAYTTMEVNAAANAGVQYVYANGCSSTSGIASAITGATSLTVQASPSPVCSVSQCVASDSLTAAPSSGNCASGEPPGSFATVSAQASYTPVAPWSSLLFPTTLTASSTIRYK